MGYSSYFRFDDDNKTKYIYSLNHHKGNGSTENTQPHILYNGYLREYVNLTQTYLKMYLTGIL